MKDKYILDSSIWIELERKTPAICKQVLPLIQKNRVCLVDVIVAEVLRGTRTKKDFQILKKAFENFRWFHSSWQKVAELAFQTAQKGFHPPLVDLYIAQCALENKRTLVTQDKHFSHIARVTSLDLILL